MTQAVASVTLVWMTILLGVNVILMLRASSATVRILTLDTLTMLLIAILTLFSLATESSFYLDSALILALLAFVATLAASRYYTGGNPFS
ncbi:MAG: monovalent cation/H+ antiporter complex subunit F [Chloroflexota bacterium]